jgi:hypothetical protein
MDLEERLDALFAVPIDEFTQTRNSLVKELTAAGDKDSASRVKALKKPTTTVWAINQLAHHHGPELEELVAIHERMATARGAADLRSAADERRRVVHRLTDLAGKILAAAGHSASTTQTQRISQSLLAATTGEQLDALRWGRLTGELEGPGFEAMSGFADAADGPAYEPIDMRARERAEKLVRAAEDAERAAEELELAAERAQGEADRAVAIATRARRKADEARRKADGASEKD